MNRRKDTKYHINSQMAASEFNCFCQEKCDLTINSTLPVMHKLSDQSLTHKRSDQNKEIVKPQQESLCLQSVLCTTTFLKLFPASTWTRHIYRSQCIIGFYTNTARNAICHTDTFRAVFVDTDERTQALVFPHSLSLEYMRDQIHPERFLL